MQPPMDPTEPILDEWLDQGGGAIIVKVGVRTAVIFCYPRLSWHRRLLVSAAAGLLDSVPKDLFSCVLEQQRKEPGWRVDLSDLAACVHERVQHAGQVNVRALVILREDEYGLRFPTVGGIIQLSSVIRRPSWGEAYNTALVKIILLPA